MFDDLSPHMLVATAAAPFAGAILLRFILGSNLLTRWMITLSTVWFAANVLMAPYSANIRADIQSLSSLLR